MGLLGLRLPDSRKSPEVSRTEPFSLSCTYQKTREGCGCFRGLFGGSLGKLRESPGKIAGKFFPNRKMLQILRFRTPGKANLPGTLGRHCLDLVVPAFRAGCFLKSTVPAFSSFPELRSLRIAVCGSRQLESPPVRSDLKSHNSSRKAKNHSNRPLRLCY